MLHFDPETGLYADEIKAVREMVAADWKNAFRGKGLPELSTEPETPAGQLIASETAAIVDKDNEVLFLANMFNPLTSQGKWQDALGKIYFLTRKTAQSSEAQCLCRGLSGTVIPQNARIKSVYDNSEWICAQAVEIGETGAVEARFIAAKPGEIEAGKNTLEQIVTVIPGWDSVTNPQAAALGRIQENQLEFELRRHASVAANARGSLAALYGAIADIQGVIDVAVLENTSDQPVEKWGVEIAGHSVWIAVTGGDDAEIAEVIYRKKDAGCGTCGNTRVEYRDDSLPSAPVYQFNIERPENVNFGVKISIKLTPSTIQNVGEKIRENIIADFNGLGDHGNSRIGTAQEIFASRFYCAAISAGVQNLVGIEIAFPYEDASWVQNVAINANQYPVLDASAIEIEIVE